MFDLATLVTEADRYPIYEKLRDEAPVLRVQMGPIPTWLLTRFDDVQDFLKRPEVRIKLPGGGPTPSGLRDGPAYAMFNSSIVVADPPQHVRLRRAGLPAFNLKAVKALSAWIDDLIEQRVNELAEMEEFDMVADLAMHVPFSVILYVLGIPEADWPALLSRVPAIFSTFALLPLDDEQRATCNEASQYYIDYFDAIVTERLKTPTDDILGRLITAYDPDQRLTRMELLGFLHSFMTAGFHTIKGALSIGAWGMLSQGEPWEALCADPGLVPAAFEEILRWEPPGHVLFRYAGEDLSIQGQTIQAGERVIPCVAAANRDERRFDNPDRIDFARDDNAHLGFGAGRHFCIGAQLARLEGHAALAMLVKRIPKLELIEPQVEREADLVQPSIKRLRVRNATRAHV